MLLATVARPVYSGAVQVTSTACKIVNRECKRGGDAGAGG